MRIQVVSEKIAIMRFVTTAAAVNDGSTNVQTLHVSINNVRNAVLIHIGSSKQIVVNSTV